MRRALLAAAAALLPAAALAAGPTIETWPAPPPAETLRLRLPGSAAARVGVVVVVPDGFGADSRARPYLDRIDGLGLASLEITLPGRVDPLHPVGGVTEVELRAAIAGALDALRRDGRLDPDRVGLLGFGAGGRAILTGAWPQPAVALYPGCDGSRARTDGPVLLVHGEDEPAASACGAQLAGLEGGVALGLPGAGAGWDAPVGPIAGEPAEEAARPPANPAATQQSSRAAGAWFERLTRAVP